jgi:hypothetical protein
MSAFEMARRNNPERDEGDEEKKKKKKGALVPSRWELLAIVVPLGFAVYYLGWVAPDLVPLPAGAKVPYPEATHLIEEVCAWCGANQSMLLVMAGGLIGTGMLLRLVVPNYFYLLSIVVTLFVGFAWYSISAPVDRLIHNVEDSIPKRKL